MQGLLGLLTAARAVPGDWAFVGRQLMLAGKYMFTNPSIALRAFAIGTGLGMMALPKTFYYPIRNIYH